MASKMHRSSGRQRAPLGALHSNALASGPGVKVGVGSKPRTDAQAFDSSGPPLTAQVQPTSKSCSPTSSSGSVSRIPPAPASGGAEMQRPGPDSYSRIPRAPEPGQSSALPTGLPAASEPAAAEDLPVFFSHVNPTFAGCPDELEALEDACAASPAPSWRTDVSGRDLTPGLLDQAVYTPATARSVQAWLRTNTPVQKVGAATRPPLGQQSGLVQQRSGAAVHRGAVTPTQTPLSAMPTSEVWHILEHMQQPAPAEQQGMYNIMNAYLRTGAQMLSPEPGCEGEAAIYAPAYMSAVVNQGSALQPARTAALTDILEEPGSVRNSSVSSCNAASAASPSLGRAAAVPAMVVQEQQPGVATGCCITVAAAVHGHNDLLPVEVGRAAGGSRRPGPPSPISFNLPADSSPEASPVRSPTQQETESPSFSFGLGAAPVDIGGEPAAAQEAAPELQRVESNTSVDQPNPFKAMLSHLRGPQYASPAPAALRHNDASPDAPANSNSELVLQPSEAAAPPSAQATPELGKGSLSHWINRRGLSQALNTPARIDLQLLWAAMRDNQRVLGEVEEMRHENAALGRELERVQGLLRELGVEYTAAVQAAEANQACAEAELAKAREAAQQMVQLSNQIQQMFNLCEAEKVELLGELAAAQQRLAAIEQGATGALSDLERAELERQIEEARLAVAAAQRAADLAESRANDACSELCSIREELQATQQQLTNPVEAAPSTEAAATPMAALRGRLQGMQEALAGLQSKQEAGAAASPSIHAKRQELRQLLVQSKQQLGSVQALLGEQDEVVALKTENQALRQQLQEAHAVLAAHTPASAKQAMRDSEMRALFGSPTPLRLSTEFQLVSEPPSSERVSPLAPGSISLAGSSIAASPALSDLFSSPYMASQTTLTVDYRELHGAVLADTAASRSLGSALSPEGSEDDCVELGSPRLAETHAGDAEQGYTVMHNNFIVTNVPASEVSKVQSMVQYWEAVACGRLLPGEVQDGVQGADDCSAESKAATPHTAVDEGMSSNAGVEAAHQLAGGAASSTVGGRADSAHREEGALGSPDAAPVPAVSTEVGLEAVVGSTAAAEVDVGLAGKPGLQQQAEAETLRGTAAAARTAEEATPGSAAAQELRSHPLATPFTVIAASWTPTSPASSTVAADALSPAPPTASPFQLPQGMAVTPAAAAEPEAEVVATPARLTPVNFAAAIPPAPHNTPHSDAKPAPTPSSVRGTPLSLSALRRAGSADMQAAVRSRLQRLKLDLQKAQAKLQTVDQGLAAINVSPVNSLASTPTLGRRSPSTPPTAQKATPFYVAAESEAASPASIAAAVTTGTAPSMERLVPCGRRAEAAAGVAASPAAVERPAPGVASYGQTDTALELLPQTEAAPGNAGDEGAAAATCPAAVASTPVGRHGPAGRFEEADVATSCNPAERAPRPSILTVSPGAGAAGASHLSPVVVSAVRRISPGPMRSTIKASPSPLRRAVFDSDSDSDSCTDSSDDEDVFDRSRMAVYAHAGTPKAAKTPFAHPEAPATTPQSVAFSSTSSFNPPEPLALMSVKPMNRIRRGAAGMAGGRRRPTETEEREFRRRAAALKIQISPYFKRR
ncbi:hypothetical protein N2152v2_009229 [Parachlorella kessleri]